MPNNCLYAFYVGKPSMCQLCQSGYAVTPTFDCVKYKSGICAIQNCLYCNSNGTCANCSTGYVLAGSGYTCNAIACGSIYGCIQCINSTSCA